MINLEQIKLLEAKVAKAVDYVERLTKENAALLQKEAEFQSKMDTYQGRIDELEVLLRRFSEDQGQIEEGILAALDKLSRFEKEMEKSLKEKPAGFHAAASKAAANARHQRASVQEEAPPPPSHDAAPQEAAEEAPAQDVAPEAGQTCFEIPDIDPLAAQQSDESEGGIPPGLLDSVPPEEENEELLDIF